VLIVEDDDGRGGWRANLALAGFDPLLVEQVKSASAWYERLTPACST
jgi:hypothetical protein